MSRYLLLLLLFLPVTLWAEAEKGKSAAATGPGSEYAYFQLEPDIITNYLNEERKHLGYIRVTVELMVEKSEYLPLVQHHSPLLRDAIIRILGEQDIKQIKSIDGREAIRVYCLEVANNLMIQEEGKKMFKDLLFTKYLYQ